MGPPISLRTTYRGAMMSPSMPSALILACALSSYRSRRKLLHTFRSFWTPATRSCRQKCSPGDALRLRQTTMARCSTLGSPFAPCSHLTRPCLPLPPGRHLPCPWLGLHQPSQGSLHRRQRFACPSRGRGLGLYCSSRVPLPPQLLRGMLFNGLIHPSISPCLTTALHRPRPLLRSPPLSN